MNSDGSLWDLYRLVFETWRFQVESYWTRAAYFAVFETGAVGAILATSCYHDPHLVLLFSLGALLLTVVWWLNNRRTHQYVDYWWNSLRQLEAQLPNAVRDFGLTSRYDHRAKESGINRLPVGYHPIVQSLPVIFALAFILFALRALNFPSVSYIKYALQPSPIFRGLLVTILVLVFLWRSSGRARLAPPQLQTSAAEKLTELLPLVAIALVLGLALSHWFPTFFTALSWMLAVFAILLATKADHVLDDIRNAVPTRFIGSFPEYLRDIHKLIEGANKKVFIMTDCVDNGAFADPVLHESVVEALHKAVAKEVEITFLIWGKDRPAHLSRANRWRYMPYEEKIADREFLRCLDKWRESHQIPEECLNPKLDKSTFESRHEKLLLAAHDELARSLKSLKGQHIKILRTESEPNLFLWVNDEEDALFLIPNAGPSTHAAAFRSHDYQLVSMLYQTFYAYRDRPGTLDYEPTAESVSEIIQLIKNGHS